MARKVLAQLLLLIHSAGQPLTGLKGVCQRKTLPSASRGRYTAESHKGSRILSAKLSRGVRFSSSVFAIRAMEENNFSAKRQTSLKGSRSSETSLKGSRFRSATLSRGVCLSCWRCRGNSSRRKRRKTQAAETSLKGRRFLSAKLSRGVCLV